MAFRRSITARSKLLSQHQRFAAPFPHIHQYDDDQKNPPHNGAVFKTPVFSNHFQRRLFGAGNNLALLLGREICSMTGDLQFRRDVGRFSRGICLSLGEGPPENMEIMTDKAVEVASQVGPVAIAAADSSMPVAAIQYLIDYVHCYTGFNWWASIVATAILIRSIQLPLSIHLFKSHLKFELQRLRMEEIKKILRNTDTSPAEKQARTKELKKILVGFGFAVSTGLLISFPIFCCSFLAVKNMAENVPSFKEGGALWFTDLSTPDTMFILPILTALTIWIKGNGRKGLEATLRTGTLHKGPLVFAALTIPLTAMFPRAVCFYWVTHTLFSLAFRSVLQKPGVKEFLGVPIIPPTPPSQSPPAEIYLEKEVEEWKKE